MIQDNDGTVASGSATERRTRWYKPIRCSICTSFIWLRAIALKEPEGVPEPRYEWVLCKSCYEALIAELSRSLLRSPMRLRVAMGLVAAERSPKAHPAGGPSVEERQFQREFAWFTWAMVLFALFHLVIFVIIWTVK